MAANPPGEMLYLSVGGDSPKPIGDGIGPAALTLDSGAAAPAVDLTLQQQQQRRVHLSHQAGILNKAGRTAELEKVLEELLEIDPKDAQALYNLGVLAHKQAENARAERFLRRAIAADPDYSDSYQALGDIYFQNRHLMSAIELYERGLARIPTRLPLLNALMRACYTLRSPHRVEAVARRVLNIDDRHEMALNFLAWASIRADGDLPEAQRCVDQVLEVKPENVTALALAESLADVRGDSAAATALGDRLLDLTLQDWSATNVAADTFLAVDRSDRAATLVRRYLERKPDDASANRYLAVTLMQDGNFAGGQEVFDQILASVDARPNLQMVYCLNAFRLGDIESFFRFHNTRWQRDGAEAKWDLPVPDWDGTPLKSGKLAVQSEQGVGDYVMFAVCLPGLRGVVRDVVIKTMGRMLKLFQRSFPDMLSLPDMQLPPDVPVEAIAAKAAAGDLPQLLGGDLEHLPGKAGVLIADPALKQKLRKRYEELFPGKRLIGISWRSGNRDSAATRSLDLPYWKPLFDLPDCAFISLQYGDIKRDLDELRAQLGDHVYHDKEVNPIGEMDPFTAQVSAMDLVISVDNSTVHFAGGLGKPCWAMLPLNSDWRWQVERKDTIWYDSVELFRPDKDSGWDGLIEEVAGRLAAVDDGALKAAEIAYLIRSLRTMMKAGKLQEAESYGRMLLAAGEYKAEAMQAIARSALGAGQAQDAVGILNRAMELDPANPSIQADLAVAAARAGDTEYGLAFAREVTRRFPKHDEPSIACGRILSDLGRYDEATDFFARVLRRDPANVDSRVALATLQAAQAEWALARNNFARVLQEDPNNPAARTALAEIDLRQGQWEEGWQNFRWRYGVRPGVLPRGVADIPPERQPKRWSEGSLRKARVLLTAERNLVEQVVLLQILGEVAKESRKLTVESDGRLKSLVAQSFPAAEIVARGQLSEAFLEERQIQTISSLGDLAARFRGDGAAFPRTKSYLSANAARAADLRGEYLANFPDRKLVGLSWRHAKDSDANRITTINDWLPLLDRADIAVVALCLGPAETELSHFAAESGRDLIYDRRIDIGGDLGDYAAQIQACDLVIAVEDLTAALAAAMGRPTVKLRKPVDHWWWGVEGAACPWFPDLRSVVASASGAASTVEEVMALIDPLLATGATGRR
jgi:tetratricopeptide (TPR) repeat protein